MSEVYTKMDPEAKAAWVKALRSGDYVQGKGRLCTVEKGVISYCCLGVLSELQQVASQPYRIDRLDGLNEGKFGRQYLFETVSDPHSSYTPNGFCGLSMEASRALSKMNDQGEVFETIANWIDENL